MALPAVYARVLDNEHQRALEDAIPWSVDHALEDLAAIDLAFRRGEKIDWDDLALLSGLPARFRHRYTPLFAKQFVVCLITATNKIVDQKAIGQGMFSCVAEELAAHLVIREADGLLLAQRDQAGLQDSETDFGAVYELLFEDIDFEWLYQEDMDGVETDTDAINDLGIAHLAFEEWFEPFPGRFVHPYAAARTDEAD